MNSTLGLEISSGLTLLTILMGQTAPAGFDASPFEFYKEVVIEDPMEEEISTIHLDSEIFSATQLKYSDLRLVGNGEREIPFLLEKARETRTKTSEKLCISKVLSLDEKPGNQIEIHLQLDEEASCPDGITILTPLSDYEKRVTVLGSNDGEDWEHLVSDALIFDYSRFMDIENRRVHLPENNHRQFRITLKEITEKQESPRTYIRRRLSDEVEIERFEQTQITRRSFRINRIDLWEEVKKDQFKADHKVEYAIENIVVSEDEENKRTNIEIDTRFEPLTELLLETPDRNFSRRATVSILEERKSGERWIEIGRGNLSVIDFRSYHREKLSISFPENRQLKYRLIIYNEDNPPLKFTGVKATGNVYRALFLTQPNTGYRLYYGSEGVAKPSYDTATVLNSFRHGYKIVEMSLGPSVSNPDFDIKSARARRSIFDNRVFLGFVIALMVLVLAWGLYSSGRKVDELEDKQ